jgi:hypothetical protein
MTTRSALFGHIPGRRSAGLLLAAQALHSIAEHDGIATMSDLMCYRFQRVALPQVSLICENSNTRVPHCLTRRQGSLTPCQGWSGISPEHSQTSGRARIGWSALGDGVSARVRTTTARHSHVAGSNLWWQPGMRLLGSIHPAQVLDSNGSGYEWLSTASVGGSSSNKRKNNVATQYSVVSITNWQWASGVAGRPRLV